MERPEKTETFSWHNLTGYATKELPQVGLNGVQKAEVSVPNIPEIQNGIGYTKNRVKPNFTRVAFRKPRKRWISLYLRKAGRIEKP